MDNVGVVSVPGVLNCQLIPGYQSQTGNELSLLLLPSVYIKGEYSKIKKELQNFHLSALDAMHFNYAVLECVMSRGAGNRRVSN